MARQIAFHASAWKDYLYWQMQDDRTLQRINLLIRECQRDPFRGVGKPEPLKGKLSGWWSRRIDESNRLLYRLGASGLEVLACRYHYDER